MNVHKTERIGIGVEIIHETIEKVTDTVFSVRVRWDREVHPVSVDLESLVVSPGWFQEKYNEQSWAFRESFNQRVRKYIQIRTRKVDS